MVKQRQKPAVQITNHLSSYQCPNAAASAAKETRRLMDEAKTGAPPPLFSPIPPPSPEVIKAKLEQMGKTQKDNESKISVEDFKKEIDGCIFGIFVVVAAIEAGGLCAVVVFAALKMFKHLWLVL